MAVTFVSALIGASSHVVVDGFTHAGRWGANWAHFNAVIATSPSGHELTIAKLLQLTGHTAGSLAALGVFALIGHRRLLEDWYGNAAVETARTVRVTLTQHAEFWSAALLPVAVATGACVATGRNPIFPVVFAISVGLLAAGCLPLRTR